MTASAPHPGRRVARAAATVVAAALLTACVAPRAAAEVVEVGGFDVFDCRAAATPGGVPDGFEPVAVYSCDEFGYEDDAGRWSATTVRRLEGELGPLLEAFAEPDDPPSIGPCPTVDMLLIEVWLVDAGDRGIRLRYPLDGCGLPKADDALWAVDALRAVARKHLDAELVEPGDAGP